MDATKDLRSCQRADCNANLIFSLFNQNVGRTGFLVNCSETGLLFTTDSPLKTVPRFLSACQRQKICRPGQRS